MTRRSVLLFDIDGTLVDCGGAGRRAMERAFAVTHGRPDAVANIAFGGMTDPAIVREALAAIDADPRADAVTAVLDAYLDALADEVPRSAGFRVLPSVEETLRRAIAAEHAVGLGTGNLKRGALIKLGRAGLAEHFAFGGFSCDAEDRAALLATGRDRGLAIAGAAARVVVVGDTPRDVTAARAIGAACLGVATGRYSLAELERAGATLTVPDLGDPRAASFLA